MSRSTGADKPLMVGFFGARGTGKTVGALRYLRAARPARLIGWDYKHDPTLSGLGREVTALPALIRAMRADRFALRYLVDHDRDIAAQFDLFCRAAWLAGDLTMFVDEVPEVTKPGRAPPAWKKLVNVGRQYRRADGRVVGVSILAAGQRAAEVDKSFMANLDVVRSGRLGHEDDARTMGKLLGVPWAELLALPDLAWVERTAGGAVSRGRISFTKKNPTARPALRRVA
ncbi:MAG: hypothetical protein NDJ19_00625 [Ramlibacter sp.]|nr:hypothetical protein [Ramlibacter sp.]